MCDRPSTRAETLHINGDNKVLGRTYLTILFSRRHAPEVYHVYISYSTYSGQFNRHQPLVRGQEQENVHTHASGLVKEPKTATRKHFRVDTDLGGKGKLKLTIKAYYVKRYEPNLSINVFELFSYALFTSSPMPPSHVEDIELVKTIRVNFILADSVVF